MSTFKHMDGTRPVAADAVAHPPGWAGTVTAQQDQRHGRIVTGGQQAEEAPDGRLVIAAALRTRPLPQPTTSSLVVESFFLSLQCVTDAHSKVNPG